MEGKKIQLMPYYIDEQGYASLNDDEIKGLYNRVLTEGLEDLLFYDGTVTSADAFVRDVKDSKTLFFVPFIEMDGIGEPLGMIWLNRLEQYHAYGHYVFFKDFWGTGLPEQASREFCEMATRELFPVLIGVTPADNDHANQFCLDYGMHRVGTIPKMVWVDSKKKLVDAVIHYISIDDFKGE